MKRNKIACNCETIEVNNCIDKNNTSDILFFSENILINDIKNITTKY